MKLGIYFHLIAASLLIFLASCKEDEGIGEVVSDFSCVTPGSNDYALPYPIGFFIQYLCLTL